MDRVQRRREQTPLVPLEHFFVAMVVPQLGGTLAVQDTNDFFIEMALWFERITRRYLADVAAGNPLHTMQVNECGVAAHTGIGRDFEGAQISHAMAVVNRQPLALHPANVTGFFIEWRNVHRFLRRWVNAIYPRIL